MRSWNKYYELLEPLQNDGKIDLPKMPDGCAHNAHMFYVKVKNLEERTKVIDYLKSNEINAVFHYVPLHSAPAGKQCGRFHGEDKYTTRESERLIRLPMYYGLTEDDLCYVAEKVKEYFDRL